MKNVLVAFVWLIVSVVPARAEIVRTCYSANGAAEVCGETTVTPTTTTVVHQIVDTSVAGNQMIEALLGVAGIALVMSGLYKLTYRSYILG